MAEQRLAVLIDAENAQAAVLGNLLSEIAKLGVANVKRIYGDFTTPQLGPWRTKLLEHSIQPVQQFKNTVGKNASDSALIIDAMDLLHSKKFDGICIVSSDSDFTRLASRIREEGVGVYGFGEQKTPKSFVAACDKFTYTENLRDSVAPVGEPPSSRAVPDLPVSTLRDAVEETAGDSGWAHLAAVGGLISKRVPDFDPRTYGFAKLGPLIEACGIFEIQRREKEGGSAVVLVRLAAGTG